ncbi:MAG: hypothetical protein PHF55_00510 [Bacteroidales bacterium]|nr:hypothetical protein [Bacteroidales bacterium]
MKKVLVYLFLFNVISFAFAQNYSVVNVKVEDSQNHNNIATAEVSIGELKSITNEEGIASFKILPGIYGLSVNATGYQPYNDIIDLISVKDTTIVILLTKGLSQAFQQEQAREQELEIVNDDLDRGISLIPLLLTSRDPYLNLASYNLSAGSFSPRGIERGGYESYINQVLLYNPELDRVNYSDISGLNDATRYSDDSYGLEPLYMSFGDIMGVSNILATPSRIRLGHQISYGISNKSWEHRLMYTYNSGIMQNGWGFAAAYSHRYAYDTYMPGTWQQADAFFFSAEKRFSERHSLSATIFASPQKRALASPTVKEAQELVDDPYYNPNWGVQNGEKRNARVRTTFKPYLILNDEYKFNDNLTWTNAFGFTTGIYGTTRLNWYNAPDPRPDYYRYLPSYQTDPFIAEIVTQRWQNDVSVSQINWDKLYQINYLANLDGKSARYIVEEVHNDPTYFYYASNIKYTFNTSSIIYGGLQAYHYETHNYKKINDLLGANYYLDIDQYAERDFPDKPEMLYNNLDDPNRQLHEGDIFGYNYKLNTNDVNLWTQYKQTLPRVDYFVAGKIGFSNKYRNGLFRSGRFPDNSKGKSDQINDLVGGLKTGATFKISGKHYIKANIAGFTKPQSNLDIFLSPYNSNRINNDITAQKVLSGDIGYHFNFKFLRGRITAYQTYILDHMDMRGFYHDEYQTYVYMSLSNMDELYQGLELGLEANIIPDLSISAAGNLGNYRYISRFKANVSFDNLSRPDTSYTVYSKNFYIPNVPQRAASIAINYKPNYWWFTLVFNYFDEMYMDFNPERRTQFALNNLGPNDPLINDIIAQKELSSGFTLDLSISKSWMIKHKYRLGVNFFLNNILDNQKLALFAFEQSRFDFDTKNIDKFPPKYMYAYGRTYMLLIKLSF